MERNRFLLRCINLIFSLPDRIFLEYKRKIFLLRAMSQVGSYSLPLKVNNRCVFTRNTFLGRNTNFNGLIIRGNGRVTIGNNFHSGEDCLFITHIHNYDRGKAIPYDDTYIYKDINIDDNVWIGSRVIILGGVCIGEGAIIQAGSCVVSDIPKYAIAGGHPASVFKYRDVEHYLKLKKAQQFH